MIIPIAHEDMGHRRWPIITIVIVSLCLLVHLVVTPMNATKVDQARVKLQEAFVYHAVHPYLKVNPPLDDFIGHVPGSRPEVREVKPLPESSEVLQQEQAQFDALGQSFKATLNEQPTLKYGYVPARHDIWQMFTCQFLHGGWLHLIFNMWFLWLCGVNLEDRWGRSVYGPFYIAAGIFASLTELFFGGIPDVPRIGASGAVAGAMGAFVIVYARTRIRFVTFFRIKPLFFNARAYIMLPLWFAGEAFSYLFDKTDGTAHAAHIGGFIFGVAFALILRQTGIEKKLDSAIEDKITVKQDPRIVEASDLVSQNRPQDALKLLDEVYAEDPGNLDVQLEILRAAKAAHQPDREIAAYSRLMQLYVRANLNEPALELFREVRNEKRLKDVQGAVLMTMGQTLEKMGQDREAAQAYEALHQGNAGSLVAVKALVAQAKIEARIGGVEYARELLTSARESPFSTKELDDVVDAELGKLG